MKHVLCIILCAAILLGLSGCSQKHKVESDLEGFDSSTDAAEDSNTVEAPDEEILWTGIPMGASVELATIKVTVTDCAETYSILTDDHIFTAEEGTKFIVFSVKAENISKEPLYLDSDTFPLYDAENRRFDPYEDAVLYLDNLVYSLKLSPNMPVEGIIVYHVPEDANGYHFDILKEDTSLGYRFCGAENVCISPEISYASEPVPTENESEIFEESGNGVTAYVKYSGGSGLNIRSAPGVENEKVGMLSEGDMITIWETRYVGATQWGRIDQGWISMNYIQYEKPVPPEAPEYYELDFFYITLPAGWEEKYVLEHSYSVRSEYIVFYYASTYDLYESSYDNPDSWAFTIEIIGGNSEEYGGPGWERVASINVFENSWYDVHLVFPLDLQFMDMDDPDLVDARSIADSIVAKDGYTAVLYGLRY